MKTWQKYQQFLSTGEWHVHTTFTDGSDTVDSYCRQAKELGIPLIAFTEHVRKTLDYDFNCFLSEIDRAREHYDLIILSGCEAKVLPDGTLDTEEWILRTVDYPIFAFHSFPCNDDLLIECLKKVMQNPWVNTWAHPLTWFEKRSTPISPMELKEIFSMMHNDGLAFELNKKYPLTLPDIQYPACENSVPFVNGSDVHSCSELTHV